MPIDCTMSYGQSHFYDLIMLVLLPSSSSSFSLSKFKFYSSFKHELSSTSDFSCLSLTSFSYFPDPACNSHILVTIWVSLFTSLNIRNNLLWRKIQHPGAFYNIYIFLSIYIDKYRCLNHLLTEHCE